MTNITRYNGQSYCYSGTRQRVPIRTNMFIATATKAITSVVLNRKHIVHLIPCRFSGGLQKVIQHTLETNLTCLTKPKSYQSQITHQI